MPPYPAAVELHLAFSFTCDDCGRDTFVRAVVPEGAVVDDISDPDERELAREILEAGGSGSFLMAPKFVACSHCGAEFATEQP